MAATDLSAIEVTTGDAPDAAVIWLHGLGADGYDFQPIVPQLRLDAPLSIRFVFPHAPARPVTLNGGMVMPAWFDFYSLDLNGPEDERGIRRTAQAIERLLERELERRVRSERIVLAGFSQGGAIALHTGLRWRRTLAGIIALSTFLPLREGLLEERSASNSRTPIFMAHGRYDQTILPLYGERSQRALQEAGYPVDWHEYPMAHGVCAEEISDIRSWLMARLG